MGRRSKYDPDTFPALAEKMASQGLAETQIAKNLGVSPHTLGAYKRKYPLFLDALKRGRKPAVLEVENALFKSATGYDIPYLEEELNGSGKLTKQKRGVTHVKPNITAQIFYLKNRDPSRWRDKQDVDMTGEIKIIMDEDDKQV